MQPRRLVLPVALVVGASCSSAHEPGPHPGSPPAAPGEAQPISIPEPTASRPSPAPSGASTAAGVDPPPANAAPQQPKRTGAPGSTKGTISCGDTRCTAPGEACFWEWEPPRWFCNPVSPMPADIAMQTLGIGVRCDDGFDCPSGETCCTTFGSFQATCVKRSDVPSICLSENCMKDGARCPPGRTCTDTTGDGGECKAPEGPATCAGKVPCPADKPICALTDAGATCVAEGSPEHTAVPGNRRYHCTRQQDCHLGDVCQYVFGEIQHPMATYCGPHSVAFMGSRVCEASSPDCHPPPKGPLKASLPWLGVR